MPWPRTVCIPAFAHRLIHRPPTAVSSDRLKDAVINCHLLHKSSCHVFSVYFFSGICESCLAPAETHARRPGQWTDLESRRACWHLLHSSAVWEHTKLNFTWRGGFCFPLLDSKCVLTEPKGESNHLHSHIDGSTEGIARGCLAHDLSSWRMTRVTRPPRVYHASLCSPTTLDMFVVLRRKKKVNVANLCLPQLGWQSS